MTWAETVTVMAIGLAGLVIFCSGVLAERAPEGIAGVGLYVTAWAYSLYRVAHD
jgi:hypothetical protein